VQRIGVRVNSVTLNDVERRGRQAVAAIRAVMGGRAQGAAAR